MSDVPIRFSKELRKRMIASQKVKGVAGYLGLLSGLKLAHLAPEARVLWDVIWVMVNARVLWETSYIGDVDCSCRRLRSTRARR